MAKNSGCCRRAKSALIRDCSPVRLPNCVEGYLLEQVRLVTVRAILRLPKHCLGLHPLGGRGKGSFRGWLGPWIAVC